MGCGGSKAEASEPTLTKSEASGKDKKFHSDIGTEHVALMTGLIHRADVKEMHKKYDTSKATELGHGTSAITPHHSSFSQSSGCE